MNDRARGQTVGLHKSATGIKGFDEITAGGLPTGRTSLVCGAAGCGKTLFGMEFLVRGAVQFGEPGVLIAFEETAEELRENVRSLGFDLQRLEARKKLLIDHVRVERSEIEESGEYNLDGLFIRLAHAVDSIKAKRVVLDTIESLFSGFSNTAILRAELRRLFGWLKERGVTAVITGERGDGPLTRQGLEEYVSDCVILLDQRVTEQLSTRRLRIVKYRGTSHGTNEYPFLIDEQGISILPITSLGLEHKVSNALISTGVPALDRIMGGRGVYRGSSVLVSGTAGTGKTSFGAHFIAASCQRGERCQMFAYEESESQIIRNLRSLGIDLERWTRKGLLKIQSSRPSAFGLEMHLVAIHKTIEQFRPQTVLMDPITNFVSQGSRAEINAMLIRLLDFLKAHTITGLYTSLTSVGGALEKTDLNVSSLMDTWLLLRQTEVDDERKRTLLVLKSRGINHSHRVWDFRLTDRGIQVLDDLGPLRQNGRERTISIGHSKMKQPRQSSGDGTVDRRRTPKRPPRLKGGTHGH